MQRRVKELDAIIKKLLEQNAMGTISDERFATLSGEYDHAGDASGRAERQVVKAKKMTPPTLPIFSPSFRTIRM
jgi:hypothetical protein